MKQGSKRSIPLSKDALQIIRGLIVGELITIVIIGGLWLWLRPRLVVDKAPVFSSSEGADTPSAPATSTFKSVTDIPIGTFKYGGSTAWASIRQLVDSPLQGSRPELQLRYVDPTNGSPSSAAGIRMLLNGKLDFTQSSRPLTEQEYAMAQRQGFTLEQRQVGIDGIAVVVNHTLKVPSLTVDQFKQIYLGQITNWKQVGGADLPITPFSQYPENADTVFLSGKQVLEKQALGSNVQYVYSTTEAVRRVNQTPGGLYYASAGGLVPQCMVKPLPLGVAPTQLIPPYREPFVPPKQCPQKRNQINTKAIKNGSYPMITKLFVIIKHNKGQEQQAGEAYTKLLLTNQGQKGIEEAGFVPVR
ncbi:MAG: PstS family phosphate ABC transporter substrate-binding protein [Brasilonema sp.]